MTERVRMWIDGVWTDAEDGAEFDATSPSTGEVVGTVAEGTRGDAGRAIEAANARGAGVGGAIRVRPRGRDETGRGGDRRTT